MVRRTSRGSVFNKRSQDLVASTQTDPTSGNLLPVATAQLDNTHPVVSTGGQQQGGQPQDPAYELENTANVALERDASDYSSDHSIERFFTNIGRGAYDAGESYTTDIASSLTGNAPIRHMKDSSLVDTFMTGAMEGRLHDSLAEAGRRITQEPGRVIGEVATEAAFMLGTMGAGVALKGIRAGAMGAKVVQGIGGKTVTGYQRSSTGLGKYFGRTLRGNNLKPKTTYINKLTTTTGKPGKDGVMKFTTQSNKPTILDPVRPLSRYIESAAQPVGESLRTGVFKLTQGKFGKPLQAVYEKTDPFNMIRAQSKIPFNPLGNINLPGRLKGLALLAPMVGGHLAHATTSDLPKGVVSSAGKATPPPPSGSTPPPSASSSPGFNTDDIPSNVNQATGVTGSNVIPTASASSSSKFSTFADLNAELSLLGKNRNYQDINYLAPAERKLWESLTPAGDSSLSLAQARNLVINEGGSGTPDFNALLNMFSRQSTLLGGESGSNALLKQAVKTITVGKDGKNIGIEKVISGGDPGADQIALLALAGRGVPTGGWVPLGYGSESGSIKEFALRMGMEQAPSDKYPIRTGLNVRDSQGTIVMHNPVSRTWTPDKVTYVAENEVLAFGSNLQGRHGKGAALDAELYHGAITNKGEGFMGEAYAIPTKKEPYVVMDVDDLKPGFANFIKWAKATPEKTIMLPAIGTNNAGFTPKQIVTAFGSDLVQPNITIPKSFWLELSYADKAKYMSLHKDDMGPGRGSALTMAIAKQKGKPFLDNPTTSLQVNTWMKDKNISILNVAGSRGTRMTDALKEQIESVLGGIKVAPKGQHRTVKKTIEMTATTQVQLEALAKIKGAFAEPGKGDWIKKKIKQDEVEELKKMYSDKAFASEVLPPGSSIDVVAQQYKQQPGIIKVGEKAFNFDAVAFDARGEQASVFDISQQFVGARIGTYLSQSVKEGRTRAEAVAMADKMFNIFEAEAAEVTAKTLKQTAKLEKKGKHLKKKKTKVIKGVTFTSGGDLPHTAGELPGSVMTNTGKEVEDRLAPILLENIKTPLHAWGRMVEGGELERIYAKEGKYLGEDFIDITIRPGDPEFSLTTKPEGAGIEQSFASFQKQNDFNLKNEFYNYLPDRIWKKDLTKTMYPGASPPPHFINPSIQNPLFYVGGKQLEGSAATAFEKTIKDVAYLNPPITPASAYTRTLINRFGTSAKTVNPVKRLSHLQGATTMGVKVDVSETSGKYMKDKLSGMVGAGFEDEAFAMWKQEVKGINPDTAIDERYAKLLKTPDSAKYDWKNAMVMNLGFGTSPKAQQVKAQLMAQPRAQASLEKIMSKKVKGIWGGPTKDAPKGLTELPLWKKAEAESLKIVSDETDDVLRLARSETELQWRTRINASKEDVLRMFPSSDGFNQRSTGGDIEALVYGVTDKSIGSVQDKKRFLIPNLIKEYKARMSKTVAMKGKGLSKTQLDAGDAFGNTGVDDLLGIFNKAKSGTFKNLTPKQVAKKTKKKKYKPIVYPSLMPKRRLVTGMGSGKFKKVKGKSSVQAEKERRAVFLNTPESLAQLAKDQKKWAKIQASRITNKKKINKKSSHLDVVEGESMGYGGRWEDTYNAKNMGSYTGSYEDYYNPNTY